MTADYVEARFLAAQAGDVAGATVPGSPAYQPPPRYLPLAERDAAAHTLLGWIAYHDPDLIQDAVTACRDTVGVREVAQELLVIGRAGVTRKSRQVTR